MGKKLKEEKDGGSDFQVKKLGGWKQSTICAQESLGLKLIAQANQIANKYQVSFFSFFPKGRERERERRKTLEALAKCSLRLLQCYCSSSTVLSFSSVADDYTSILCSMSHFTTTTTTTFLFLVVQLCLRALVLSQVLFFFFLFSWVFVGRSNLQDFLPLHKKERVI